MCQLLEKAREVQGNISYYEVAKRMNVNMQQMTKWKNDIAKPNGLNTLKLAKLANLTTSEALRIVESGFITLSQIFVTGSLSILAIAGFLIHQVCILC